MNEEFRQDDGKTAYRTFILYLFVRRSVPTSILQYQFANDMVRTKLLEKYFEDRSGKMSFSDRAVDACADYVLQLWEEWKIDKDIWYDKYSEMDRLSSVLDELTKLNN